MLHLMGPKKAEKNIEHYSEWIDTVSDRYGVPAAAIKAILYQEMTMIDIFDPIVDAFVALMPRFKSDSSTGHAQIFGRVGLDAVNYAVDHDLASYESLGFDIDHRLDSGNPTDVRSVWSKLRDNPKANIEIATLNLLVAADEVIGHTDFGSFTDDEFKLVLTRYNADVRHVTPYGEKAFEHFQRYSAK